MESRQTQLNTKKKILVITSLVMAILLFLALIGGMYARAWFKNVLEIENPAQLTNFITKTEYSFDGTQWTELSAGQAITVSVPNSGVTNDLSKLQVRVSYQGHSAAYIRASVQGNFYNVNTGTYLPQPESFWSLSEKNTSLNQWISSDEYIYFASRVSKYDTMTALPSDLCVNAKFDELGTISRYQEYEGKVYIIVEAVQPDRYAALWGIDTLPF